MVAKKLGWDFGDYMRHVAIIAVPAALSGFILCVVLETFKIFGYGYELPKRAYDAIVKDYNSKFAQLSKQSLFEYALQGTAALLLFAALALHVAEVGLIGIALMVFMSAFKGITKEHDFAESFNHSMPFALLITIFFAVLAVVDEQHLVKPLIRWTLTFDGNIQLMALYFTNGALSLVSDNIFVASVFINEIEIAYGGGKGFTREWFEKLGVVVCLGTNMPTMGTPNGHAALLFLLTSSLAPLVNLSYWQIFKLALPYTIVLTVAGAVSIFILI
jgi:NhaB family Na+:H+ antiporter